MKKETNTTTKENIFKITIGGTYWYNTKTDTLFYDEEMTQHAPMSVFNNSEYSYFLEQLQKFKHPTTTKGELLQDERETFNLMLDRLEEKNKKLLDSNRELLDAIQFYQKGVGHFFKCINWGKSFLDAEAIQFMNDHEIKFNKAIKKI